jgi:hypothetical protein
LNSRERGGGVGRGDAERGAGCFSARIGRAEKVDEVERRSRRGEFDDVEAGALTQAFITPEEEDAVLDQASAETAAELVEAQLRLIARVEEVARIELVIPKIIKDASVKVVAAALSDDVDLPAGAGAVLRRIIRRIDAKFLDIFERGLEAELRALNGQITGR